MKKILSTLLIAAGLLIAYPSQAQIKFGVKGGLNLVNADVSGLKDNFKAENTTGFFIGPMVDIKVPLIGIGVDGSFLFSEKGIKYTNTLNNADATNKQRYFEIPINLKYSIGLGDMASIFLAAGPDFSFNVKSDNIMDDLKEISGSNSSASIDSNNSEVYVNVGGGVKLLNHLQIGINYSLPLSDSAKKNFSQGEMSELGNVINGSSFKSKTKTWQVSVAYLF